MSKEYQFPTPFQRKALWSAVTGLAILIVGALLVGLIWLSGSVLGFLQPVLVPVAVAGVIAYLLDPIVNWLQVKKRLNRFKAVASVFGGFIIVAAILSAFIIPPVMKQLGTNQNESLSNRTVAKLRILGENDVVKPVVDYLLSDTSADSLTDSSSPNPEPLEEAQPTEATPSTEATPHTPPTTAPSDSDEVAFANTQLAKLLQENKESVSKFATSWLSAGTSKVLGIFGLMIGFAMVPIYLYYFLQESSAIKESWHDYVPLKASKFKTEVVGTLSEINGYLISFFRGQVLVAFIDGILVGIALAIFGLPFGLIIGIVMAIVGVIPFIGNIICLVPACIIAYVHFSYDENQWGFLAGNPLGHVGMVVAIFIIVQQINSLVTAPKIVGDSVGLHPMTVIFSMLFWSLLLGGFIGALLAVPLTAAVKVILRRYVWQKQLDQLADT